MPIVSTIILMLVIVIVVVGVFAVRRGEAHRRQLPALGAAPRPGVRRTATWAARPAAAPGRPAGTRVWPVVPEPTARWTPEGTSGLGRDTAPMTTCRLTGPGGIDLALRPRSGPVLVGRHRDATLMLPEPTVSARHARLEFQRGTWWLADDGSRNGTWIDDRRVGAGDEGAVALDDGARIRFGRTGPELTFHRRNIDPTNPPGHVDR